MCMYLLNKRFTWGGGEYVANHCTKHITFEIPDHNYLQFYFNFHEMPLY